MGGFDICRQCSLVLANIGRVAGASSVVTCSEVDFETIKACFPPVPCTDRQASTRTLSPTRVSGLEGEERDDLS